MKGNLTMGLDFNLPAHTILRGRSGSKAYGTNIEGSDDDYKAIAVSPWHHAMGFRKSFEQHVTKYPDETTFSLRKFFTLAAECNPNIVELLYTDPADLLLIRNPGHLLLDARDSFLSKKAKNTFSGYAHQQLSKINTHRRWLLTPPKEQPQRKAFGLGETTKVSKSELGAFEALMAGDEVQDLEPNVLKLFIRERQYQASMREWEQYENWKLTRNAGRAALEAEHGYDTKHGMHLIRLMRMCTEILRGDGLIVKRPDAKELVEIRMGAWSYDKLMEEANKLKAQAEVLAQITKLPKEPNYDVLEQISITLHIQFYKHNNGLTFGDAETELI
jgi:predicted nucleotidyltransferase